MDLTGRLLQSLQTGSIAETPQDPQQARWYGRPRPADLFIDWQKMTATQVKALVKACNPWLKGAPTRYNGWTLGITDASLSAVQVPAGTVPGTILQLSEEESCVIACKDGSALKADVIYSEEGFFAGAQLLRFGLKAGSRLG
jgi:methionyl-tRNA formyltransferase